MSQENENGPEKSIPPAGQDPESISRRAFVGTVAAAGAAALAGSAAAGRKKAAEKAPVWSGTLGPAAGAGKLSGLNIIVIIADTFRADHVGCYGSRRVKTPNLDKVGPWAFSQIGLWRLCPGSSGHQSRRAHHDRSLGARG